MHIRLEFKVQILSLISCGITGICMHNYGNNAYSCQVEVHDDYMYMHMYKYNFERGHSIIYIIIIYMHINFSTLVSYNNKLHPFLQSQPSPGANQSVKESGSRKPAFPVKQKK